MQRISQLSIPATDDFALAATVYYAADPVTRVLLVNSATGVPRAYYAKFAQFMVKQGITVVTYDYRGIGESRPASLVGFKANMSDWGAKDVAGMIAWIKTQLQPEKLFVIGHSIGACATGLAKNNAEIDALLVVSAPNGYWRYWPVKVRYLFMFLWYVLMPVCARTLGYFPTKLLGISGALPRGVAVEWARWCRHPDFLFCEKMAERRQQFAQMRAPILGYSFSDDAFSPESSADWTVKQFTGAASQSRRHITPAELNQPAIGHVGCFRSCFAESLWRQWLEWFN